GAAAYTAEQTYFAAADKQKTLETQFHAATARAAKSKQQLGQYVGQLARTGGDDGGVSLNLLLDGKGASQLLDNLGTLSKASQREEDIYKQARADRNSVDQLSKLASAQTRILDKDKQTAEVASAAAAASAANLQTALTAKQAQESTLNLQLAALTTKLNLTEKQYDAGVRAAAAAAAAAAARGGGGGGGGGVVDSSGWALPTVGVITSPYGYRNDPAAGGEWRMHYGDDIADGCLRPIYAAHRGKVSYAGPYGDIGNYIQIQDGDQYSTAYGHIANGETFVHIGQTVSAGQMIARTGSTGFSTGCHLYFQVFVSGVPTNPVPFMRARGVILGQ
ncbi:MAG TPA: M23 family metallopeptidase, partial [Galbitalea sp.]